MIEYFLATPLGQAVWKMIKIAMLLVFLGVVVIAVGAVVGLIKSNYGPQVGYVMLLSYSLGFWSIYKIIELFACWIFPETKKT